MKKLPSLGLLAVLALAAAGCGEDEPNLYIVNGPHAVRAADGSVSITGELWSVIPWPADHEFCVTVIWNEPSPSGPGLNMDQECSINAVPLEPNGNDGFHFELHSFRPPTAGSTIDITVVSDHFGQRGEAYAVTIDSP
jgi:hypothetical protein